MGAIEQKIREEVREKPGINQTELVTALSDFGDSKNTLIRRIEEQVGKTIRRSKNNGVRYTPIDFETDEQVEKALRYTMEEISKLVSAKTDVENLPYGQKQSLNDNLVGLRDEIKRAIEDASIPYEVSDKWHQDIKNECEETANSLKEKYDGCFCMGNHVSFSTQARNGLRFCTVCYEQYNDTGVIHGSEYQPPKSAIDKEAENFVESAHDMFAIIGRIEQMLQVSRTESDKLKKTFRESKNEKERKSVKVKQKSLASRNWKLAKNLRTIVKICFSSPKPDVPDIMRFIRRSREKYLDCSVSRIGD